MNVSEFLKKRFYYRMHPDTALRYYPIVDLLKKKGLEKSQILEVGSGSYGIAPYLKQPITGLDLSFDEPQYELLHQVLGSGENIDYKDNSFDVVILSDVLEHMPKTKRSVVINECVRVARKFVIVSGPCGKLAFAHDQKLAKLSSHHFFADHLKYGLPEVEEIINISQKNTKVKSVSLIGEYLNLNIREILMRLFVSKSRLVYYFYLKGLMPFVPILKVLNFPPCYRSLILLGLKK